MIMNMLRGVNAYNTRKIAIAGLITIVGAVVGSLIPIVRDVA